MRGHRQESEPLDIESVLNHYGVAMVPRGGWKPVRCPFHEDRNASASVSTDRGAFCCHGCDAKGDSISLLMWKEDLGRADAIKRYEEITGRSAKGISGAVRRKSSRPLHVESADYERSSSLFGPRIRRR